MVRTIRKVEASAERIQKMMDVYPVGSELPEGGVDTSDWSYEEVANQIVADLKVFCDKELLGEFPEIPE